MPSPGRWILALALALALVGGRLAAAVEPTPMQDDASLFDVQFVGAKTGWAVGDHGVVWRTNDGGQSWQLLNVTVDCSLRKVCFLTDRIGWIVGGGVQPFLGTSFGVVLSTADGGASWQRLDANQLPQLHDVKFFGLKDGIAVGDSSANHPTGVFVTADGGSTWNDLDGPAAAGWRASDFLDVDRGTVAGLRGGVASVAGNRLMPSRFGDLSLRGFHDIDLQTDQTGWLVGDGGLAMLTVNGGVVWQSPPTPFPEGVRDICDFRAVACRGPRVWIAGEPGSVIWHSAEHGRRWTKQTTGQPQPIHSLSFRTEMDGWAVGALGTMLRTTDGGHTWAAVRGAGRRVALMALHVRPSQVSVKLLAQYSADLGYRSAVSLLARRDMGPDGHSEQDLDLRLHDAVTTAGGSSAHIGWQLPVSLPGLERDAKRLQADWQRQTEGRLEDVVLGSLVRQLRTWRPSIVIYEQPAEDDAATELLNAAVMRAVREAADPTLYVQQHELAGLEPWLVEQVFRRLPPGSTGHVHLDPHELLPRVGETIDMAAKEAEGKLLPGTNAALQHEAYRLVIDNRAEDETVPATGNLFSRVPLAPGSAARRPLASMLDDAQSERRLKIAQQQRNFQAYTERFLHQKQFANQVLAELPNIVRDMPDEQAALQLAQLAAEYRRLAEWELAEATLVQLVHRYPNQAAAVEAMRWLLQTWCSTEVAWQRSRRFQVTRKQISGKGKDVEDRVQQALKLVRQFPDERVVAGLEADADPLSEVVKTGLLMTDRQDEWRSGTVRNWHDQALKMAQLIRKTAPQASKSPAVEFPLAAILRQRGLPHLADSIYRSYLRGGEDDPWQRTSLTELWLANPINVPPKETAVCHVAPTRPTLDGVLSDACWQDATPLRLTDADGDANGHADARTKTDQRAFALLAYDAEYLYVAANVPRAAGTPDHEPHYEGRTHDADLSAFDRLSLFLDVDRDYTTFFAIHVDQRGWSAESCWEDARWNPKLLIAADADETNWRVELAIPFDELVATAPLRNSVWAIGVIRTIPALGVQSWSQPAGSKPRPESFGLLRF